MFSPAYCSLIGGDPNLVLPADTTVLVPALSVNPAGPVGLIAVPPAIGVPDDTVAGDYQLDYMVNIAVQFGGPGVANITAILSLNGDPNAGGQEIKPSICWHDLTPDAGGDDQHFNLQASTLWPLAARDTLELYLVSRGSGSIINLNIAAFEAVKVGP